MTFLSEPRPEKICALSWLPGGGSETYSILTIGLTVTTYTPGGLKIVPTKEIRFAIGKKDDEESSVQNVPISMARDLAARIIEMCDVAEKGKTQ